jgi:hypothetical protein
MFARTSGAFPDAGRGWRGSGPHRPKAAPSRKPTGIADEPRPPLPKGSATYSIK